MDQNGPDALPSFKAPKQHLGCLEAGVSSCSPGPKMAQDGSGDGPKAERPKTAQDAPQDGSRKPQDGTRWARRLAKFKAPKWNLGCLEPRVSSCSPRWPKMAPRWPRRALLLEIWWPSWSHFGPKRVPRWPRRSQYGPDMAPRWTKMGPTTC